MIKYLFCLGVFTFASAIQLHAQDSLAHKSKDKTKKGDSVKSNLQLGIDSVKKIGKSADSFQKKINHRSDSLQRALTPKNLVQSLMTKRAHKKDSLSKKNQAKSDSLPKNAQHENDTVRKDSVKNAHRYSYKSLDSLQKKFNHRSDSLQRAFASPMGVLQAMIAKRSHKRDSLSKKGHSTDSLAREIDSLKREQTSKMNELNAQLNKAKKETLDKISSLHLPPQAQSEINSLTKNINGFKVPNNFFALPNLKMAGLSLPSNMKIPSLNLLSNLSIPSMNIPSLQKVNISSMKIPSLAQMEGSLGSEIKKLQSLKSVDAKSLEKEAMKVASQNSEVKSILKEETQVKDMKKQLDGLKNTKRPDSLAMQQLLPKTFGTAVNHFAGKEKELTAAMDQVSKLKQKYSSVKSLAELPKRAPNPLKDKPWIERVVPGLNYFIQNKHYTLIDFNPYVGWRFNPRLTASIGWNQRIGISHYSFSTHTYDHVYGVRASASYLWTRGINFKVSPEVMNAYIPTNGKLDVRHESWVWGIYAGVRKDFPIYKSLKGYSEVMYNFTQKTFQNIYGDPVSFRFGMELKLKKKAKKNGVGMVNPSSLKKTIHLKDSFLIIKKEKLFGVVGIKGDTLVPVKYQSIKKFVSDGKLYFIVKKDKKFGALSSDGKESVPVSHQIPATVKFEIIDRVRSKYQLDQSVKLK